MSLAYLHGGRPWFTGCDLNASEHSCSSGGNRRIRALCSKRPPPAWPWRTVLVDVVLGLASQIPPVERGARHEMRSSTPVRDQHCRTSAPETGAPGESFRCNRAESLLRSRVPCDSVRSADLRCGARLSRGAVQFALAALAGQAPIRPQCVTPGITLPPGSWMHWGSRSSKRRPQERLGHADDVPLLPWVAPSDAADFPQPRAVSLLGARWWDRGTRSQERRRFSRWIGIKTGTGGNSPPQWARPVSRQRRDWPQERGPGISVARRKNRGRRWPTDCAQPDSGGARGRNGRASGRPAWSRFDPMTPGDIADRWRERGCGGARRRILRVEGGFSFLPAARTRLSLNSTGQEARSHRSAELPPALARLRLYSALRRRRLSAHCVRSARAGLSVVCSSSIRSIARDELGAWVSGDARPEGELLEDTWPLLISRDGSRTERQRLRGHPAGLPDSLADSCLRRRQKYQLGPTRIHHAATLILGDMRLWRRHSKGASVRAPF
jgi:hypothetical protein